MTDDVALKLLDVASRNGDPLLALVNENILDRSGLAQRVKLKRTANQFDLNKLCLR